MTATKRTRMDRIKLSDSERKIAEQNHGIVMSYLRENNLPYDEFYDVAALGYLRGIVNYNRDERLICPARGGCKQQNQKKYRGVR